MSHESISGHAQRLGRVLRRHRQDNNQSLGDLSRLTGLSKTSLMRLEAGEGNPSLETLWRIGHELGMSIAELIDQPSSAPTKVTRAGEGTLVQSALGMRGRLLQNNTTLHRTEVFELSLPPNACFRGDPHEAGTREFVHCVASRIICGPPEDPLLLEAGDSAEFDGAASHHYAGGPEGGRAILVMSYPPARRAPTL